MYKKIFNIVKSLIPKISKSELIALNSGQVSIDRDIFKGLFTLPNKLVKVRKFDVNIVNNLINEYSLNFHYPNNYKAGIDFIRNNKFLSFIIDEKYNGSKLSINEQSRILTKISSSNPALGVCVMVPNSLGPAELLQKYGTNNQKNYYLPKLANGELIPCFGLTGPNNGSDAIGNIDEGILIKTNDNKYYIDLNINKRYITLAPIADLIGIAFRLKDPNNYLNIKDDICLALIEKGHNGLIQDTYHNPMDVGFPNGTLKGNIKLNFNNIIGGEKEIGNGWKMLMECLSEGRAISLPACANASSKVSTFGIYHYINNRKQFNLELIKMQAIQKKFLTMIYNTFIINSSIHMTNNILDNNIKSSVISAIMKYNTTERGRIVINEAMDIYAGSAICLGNNNFLNKFYKSLPIGITVEGSNTLTKNLIIFGQGINKSHPYIGNILNNILNDDLNDFKNNFNNLLKHFIITYFKSFKIFNNKIHIQYETVNELIKDDYNIINNNIINNSLSININHQISIFAFLSNILSLKGGKLKKEQYISGLMADYLCNIYNIKSILWYEKYNGISNVLCEYNIKRLLNENIDIINEILINENLEYILIHLINLKKYKLTELENKIFKELKINYNILNNIKEDIYLDNILSNLENLTSLKNNEKNSKEYYKLYNDVINVGEFEIKNNN
jgi:acyl-CoA dehydrogenase